MLNSQRLFAFVFLLFSTHQLFSQNERLFKVQNHLFPKGFLKKNRLGVTPILKRVSFQSGDTIADIGAGNGWFACALSMHYNGLTFYLEDVDSTALHPARLKMAIKHYSQLKGEALNNQFLPVLGTASYIPLPNQSVHKILLIDAYHHFSHRPEMLNELYRILKKGGQLLVVEVIARKTGDIHPGCHNILHLQSSLLADFANHQFQLAEQVRIGRDVRRKKRLVIFEKK